MICQEHTTNAGKSASLPEGSIHYGLLRMPSSHAVAAVPPVERRFADEVARAVASMARIQAVPTLLDVLCDTTGMGFAAVARVTDDRWIACAVRDRIESGVAAGTVLDLNTALSIDVKRASNDPQFRDHPVPALRRFKSYISVPIVMSDGRYFGTLCALDRQPANVSGPKILSMFEGFAKLIAYQLHEQEHQEEQTAALIDERAVSELREQFIAILGHELRNPLQALFAACDSLAKRHPDDWTLALVARLKSSSRRMAALIDDVLDLARSRMGGGIGVEIQTVDQLPAALQAVINELVDARPERVIFANIDVAHPVRCDVRRIQQLASNLLSNAFMHGAPLSPVRFDVREDGLCLVLEVWNDGDPIPAESIAKIFSPFWRHAASANRDGLGLGLYICSQVAHAHGGQLSVTSSKHDGTRFTARLPCFE